MDVLSITLGISTALSGGGAMFLWLETRTQGSRSRREKKLTEKIDQRLAKALGPIQSDLQSLHGLVSSGSDNTATLIKIALAEAMLPVREQLTALNTKVDPLWSALISVGINQADVLHQPDPRRAEVDGLLEKLQEELRGGRLMSANDFLRMRHFLVLIKGWEPGQDLGFPVLPAEPTSAAILLAIMDLSRQRRRREEKS